MEKRTFGQIVSRFRKHAGALFIGAGCSATAGIFTAQKFADEVIRSEYEEDWNAAATKDYAGCMDQLDPGERRGLVQRHVRNKPLNVAHVAIASLIRNERVQHVVTTNFDSLLIRACGLLGVEVAVFDVAALSSEDFRIRDIGMPAIFYVHGQFHGFTQYHVPGDFRPDHSAMLRKLIHDISESWPWLVAGYSGENDSSANALASQQVFAYGLFWAGYLDEPPCASIQNALLDPSKRAFWLSGYDADRLFLSLAHDLGCDQDLDLLLGGRTAGKGLENAARQYRRLLATEPRLNGPEQLTVPPAHRGLLLTLPPLKTFSNDGYKNPEELAAGVASDDFRRRAFDTNWGPPIVAIEHHGASLRHCWIVCTPKVPLERYELAVGVIRKIAPAVKCHPVRIGNPNSILEVQRAIEQVYTVEAPAADLAANELIADITGGLSTITGGIVLATLDEDRPIEYLTQGVPLVQEGRALTPQEIRDQQLLVAIRTTGEMAREVMLRAS